MSQYGTHLLVNKKNIRNAQILSKECSASDLLEGEILLEVESFAYTSNNTTYAVFGDRIGYWHFYPTSSEDFGMIPCWGFAKVTASRADEIAVGSRYYGFYPMGTQLIAQPGKISPFGWTDIKLHRGPLPAIYNQYYDCATDPIYRPEVEGLLSVFRPLFTTSYLIHDMYAGKAYMGAEQIILTSASSKTALALAFCLKDDPVKVIGLTSPHRVDQVKASGYYDTVVAYNDVASIDHKPSSIVDFSGSSSVKNALADHLEDKLTYLCLVGFVDWEAPGEANKGPKGEMFFAPAFAQQKVKEVGIEAFTASLGKQLGAFISDSVAWISLENTSGPEALLSLHRLITDGKADASKGYIVSL